MTKELQSDVSSRSRLDVSAATLPFRDMLQVMAVILLWAICYPLITTGLAASPPFHLAATRSLLAGASLLLAGMVYKRPLLPGRDTWFAIVIISLTFTSLGFAGMFLAGGLVTPGLATVVANAQPLLAALLGYFLLTERLTGARGMAMVGGFVGIIVIAIPGFLAQAANSTPLGIGLVLIGAVGVATGNVLLKRIAHQVDPLIAMAWILILGAVPLIAAAAIFEQPALTNWSISSVASLVVLSVFGTALAFVLWLDVLGRAELNLLNTYTFLTPVFGLIIGLSFYDERLSSIEWIGVAIIAFAVLLAGRPMTQSPGRPLIKDSAGDSRRTD